jgi:hypothetical protein
VRAWPGHDAAEAQVAGDPVARELLALLVDEHRLDAGERDVAGARLARVAPGSGAIRMPPVSVCHHVSTTAQRLVADDVVVPPPDLGVDRLADRAEHAQRRRECRVTNSSPAFAIARNAVGAV